MTPYAPSTSRVALETQTQFLTVSREEMLPLSSEWRSLSERGGGRDEPFSQPEWFFAYSRAFETNRPIHLVVTRGDGRLKGLIPFVSRSSFFGHVPARTLRSLSGIHSCRFDLVHGDSEPSEVARDLWSSIREQPNWDVIEALDVPSDGAFRQLLTHATKVGFLTATWSTRKSPYLLLPTGNGDPFKNCPANYKSFRARLPNKLRKLQQEGAVSFQIHTTDCHQALTQFLALESSGWKGLKGSSIASDTRLVHFYSAIVEELARRGFVRMYSLLLDRQPVAMHLGLAMNKCYYAPKVAYDETFARFSPGQILVHYAIADLTRAGFEKYDFLGPRAVWKSVWTDRVRDHHNCYIFRPTVRGRCLHALTMKGGQLIRRLRYRVKGDPQRIETDRG